MRSVMLDRGGNTLAIMAAALIPLSAMAGSAVDMARMYVVKVRLQQACDAGALAGRKYMAADSGTALDATAANRAKTFFANNFKTGWYGTTATSFVPSRTSDNQVAATATTTIPMTVMKMFGKPDVVMTATCMARFDVADVDTMFVLDTTGSMTCAANEGSCTMTSESYTRPDGTIGYSYVEKSSSKIKALRSAVLAYYDTLTSSSDASTKLRFGFVTYSSTVNAGKAILDRSPSYMVSPSWFYQSRRVIGENIYSNNTESYTGMARADCRAKTGGREPGSGWDGDGRAVRYTYRSWSVRSGGTCTLQAQRLRPRWRYDEWPADLTDFLAGRDVQDPSKVTPAMTRWTGCIEERVTTSRVMNFNQGNLPPDLDPDRVPTDNDTRWRPMWPESVYQRPNSGSDSFETENDMDSPGSAGNQQGGATSCGKPVRRLDTMDRTAVSNYVNAVDFRALGGTYHDVGMIWGTRLISPTGVFASDTAAWPNRNAPNRNIIFMTDGEMSPNQGVYGMYGLEWNDQRIANGDFGNLTSYHNARFLAECEAAKARNITVWVVAFGQSINNELRTCASTPDRAFFAADNATLTTQFQSIASRIAMLRLSQ